MGAISDDILLGLTHSNDHVVQHLLHEESLLRMDHLVVAVFYFSIDSYVSDIQSPIVLEPLIV